MNSQTTLSLYRSWKHAQTIVVRLATLLIDDPSVASDLRCALTAESLARRDFAAHTEIEEM